MAGGMSITKHHDDSTVLPPKQEEASRDEECFFELPRLLPETGWCGWVFARDNGQIGAEAPLNHGSGGPCR